MTARIPGIVIVVACSVGVMGASPTALKPFDPIALQGAVETTAKELLLPGAMVLLRTPQGFAFGYGATELGGTSPPRGDTHFRIGSNTKTMTAAVIVLLAQEGKLRFDDPVSKYVSGVPDGDNITINRGSPAALFPEASRCLLPLRPQCRQSRLKSLGKV